MAKKVKAKVKAKPRLISDAKQVLIRKKDAMKKVGLRVTAFDEAVANKILPAPVFHGDDTKTPFWVDAELDAHIARRIAARDAKLAAKKAETEARA